jgi:hypothetical protein
MRGLKPRTIRASRLSERYTSNRFLASTPALSYKRGMQRPSDRVMQELSLRNLRNLCNFTAKTFGAADLNFCFRFTPLDAA